MLKARPLQCSLFQNVELYEWKTNSWMCATSTVNIGSDMEKSDMEATATTLMQYCSSSTEKLRSSAALAGGLTQLRYYSTVVFSVTHSNRHWPAWGPIPFFRSKAEGLCGGQFEAERGGLSGGWASPGGGGAAVGGGQRKSEESGVRPIYSGDNSGQQPSGHTNGVCTTAGPSDWTLFNTHC